MSLRVWRFTIVLCLLPSLAISAAEIPLHIFSDASDAEPAQFNENFMALKQATMLCSQTLEALKGELSRQRELTDTLSRRIQDLETEVAQLRERGSAQSSFKNTTASAKAPSPAGALPQMPEYVGDLFRVQVVSAQKGPTITLRLKFTNLTDRPLNIAWYSSRENTYVIDENSNQYPFKESDLMNSRSVEIIPHGQRVITVDFAKTESRVQGTRYEFYTKMYYHQGRSGLQEQMSFQISNIPM